MKNENDEFVYIIAIEKMLNMIFTIEQTIEFMNEQNVKPDEEVKKALIPIIEQLKKWLES